MTRQRRVRYVPVRYQDPGNPTLSMELREFWLAAKHPPHEQHHIDHIAELAHAYIREWGHWPKWVVMDTEWYEQICIEWTYRINAKREDVTFPDNLPIGNGLEIVLADIEEPTVVRTAAYEYIRQKSGKEKT